MRSETPAPPKPDAVHPSRSIRWLGLILLGALALVFGPSLKAGFVIWDDNIHIMNNALLRPPYAAGLLAFWTGPFFGLYIPVTYSLWSLLAQVSALWSDLSGSGMRLDPRFFHGANIVVHGISSLLVMGLVRRLCSSILAGAVAAMVFAFHPLQVESVGWVSGMKDLLGMALLLQALWCLGPLWVGETPLKRPRIVGSTVFFVLSLLAKPSMVAGVPLVMLGLLPPWSRWRHGIKTRLQVAGIWLCGALPITLWTYGLQHEDGKAPLVLWWQKPLVAADALVFYAQKWLIPTSLVADYGRSPAHVLEEPWTAAGKLAALLTLAALLWTWRRSPPVQALGFYLLMTVVLALPNLGLLGFEYQRISTVADRYAYLMMLAPALGLGYGTSRLTGAKSALATLGMTLIALFWAFRSHDQVRVWDSTETLFRQVLTQNDRSTVAHNNLGIIEFFRGELGRAQDHWKKVLAENPWSYQTMDNLGVAAREEKRLVEALAWHEEALSLEPNYAGSHVNRAETLAQLGRQDEAMTAIDQALAKAPRHYGAHIFKGHLLAKAGRLDEADSYFQKAMTLHPKPAVAAFNLGVMRERAGRWAEARQYYQEALRFSPKDADARARAEALEAKAAKNGEAIGPEISQPHPP